MNKCVLSYENNLTHSLNTNSKHRQATRGQRGSGHALRGGTIYQSRGCDQTQRLLRQLAAAADGNTIRPFHISVPDEQLVDLRRRLAATRWPDRETVNDGSQGVQLAKFQELVRYWGTDYDWRKAEAKLNALPQFMTTIDDVDIHFIHVRSRHPNAMPLIMTHGWPGSVFELLKTVGPLRKRTAGLPQTLTFWSIVDLAL